MPKARRAIPQVSMPDFMSAQATFAPGARAAGALDKPSVSVTLAGNVDYRLDDQRMTLGPMTALLVGKGCRQDWRIPGPEPWTVVYVVFEQRVRWDGWIESILDGRSYRALTGNTTGHAAVGQALRDADAHRRADPGRLERELATNALERALLLMARLSSAQPVTLDPRVHAALQWAQGQLHRPVSVEDLARAASCSRSNFCRLFAHATGQTPARYIERLRMERARDLLRTTRLEIKQIGGAVGFEDAKYFSKRFRRMTGMSPSRARYADNPQARGRSGD